MTLRPVVSSVLMVVGFALSAAERARVPGYLHSLSETAQITLVLMTYEIVPPHKLVEFASWPVQIAPNRQIYSVVDLVPQPEFSHRCDAEAKERKLGVPDLRFVGPIRVLRGTTKSVVASSGRKLLWPDGFLLQSGDILEVYPLTD